MKVFPKLALVLGIVLLLLAVLATILREPEMPVPLAICGTGVFIGAAILTTKS